MSSYKKPNFAGKKTKVKILIAVVCALVLTISLALTTAHTVQSDTSSQNFTNPRPPAIQTQTLNMTETPSLPLIKPNVTTYNQNASVIAGIPWLKVSSSSSGIATGAGNLQEGHVVLSDKSLMITLYERSYMDRKDIAVTATNIGSKDVSLNSFGIVGGISSNNAITEVLDAEVVGCNNNVPSQVTTGIAFPNGTVKSQNESMTMVCGNPASIQGPVTVKPDHSLTGYISGNFTAGTMQIDQFASGASYRVDGIEYVNSIQYQSVK